MEIFTLGISVDDDYPNINWDKHASMAGLWTEVDERMREGESTEDLLLKIKYKLRFNRRWPKIDFVRMGGPIGVSENAKRVLTSLKVPGMQFLPYLINDQPYYLFFTERQVNCLDREKSKIEFYRHDPKRIKRVSQYAFVSKKIKDCDVFTIPETSDGMFYYWRETFFTKKAQLELENAGLIGAAFDLVSK